MIGPSDKLTMAADEALFYNQSVALPLSLLNIQARLSNRFYRQIEAVRGDIQLIASNARDFNGQYSSIARSARGKAVLFVAGSAIPPCAADIKSRTVTPALILL